MGDSSSGSCRHQQTAGDSMQRSKPQPKRTPSSSRSCRHLQRPVQRHVRSEPQPCTVAPGALTAACWATPPLRSGQTKGLRVCQVPTPSTRPAHLRQEPVCDSAPQVPTSPGTRDTIPLHLFVWCRHIWRVEQLQAAGVSHTVRSAGVSALVSQGQRHRPSQLELSWHDNSMMGRCCVPVCVLVWVGVAAAAW